MGEWYVEVVTYFVAYIFHYGVVEVDVDGVFGGGMVVGYDVYMVVSYYKSCQALKASTSQAQLHADC